ncbi:TetR/AcrR family transcriptional regulator [Micromonospora sp. KC606]|uniref:TetR/AcrR family transcriptional regulator n=1 Tax=Micromonospora sp. KC606 TaxID=2530379 RepID=UPI00104501E4|nr:TetR/AcrR family transcriptional regulator [Micromonospora sp. KC606]TDC72601.1 TetR/AcrR family transcriptional regulator [Micromonospora sp. KC606]
MAEDQGGDVNQGKKTRRRGAALERAILQAAAEELAEVGYSNLTMDAVAARAGTSKNVIYRRWPNRAALSVAAYRQMLPTDPKDTPNAGDLRSDALALLNRANDRLSSPAGKILREILSDIQNDPDRVREIHGQLVNVGVAPWLTILARATARGEVGPEALTPRVASVAVDLLRNEYVINGVTKVPASTIIEIVDQIFLPLVRAHR